MNVEPALGFAAFLLSPEQRRRHLSLRQEAQTILESLDREYRHEREWLRAIDKAAQCGAPFVGRGRREILKLDQHGLQKARSPHLETIRVLRLRAIAVFESPEYKDLLLPDSFAGAESRVREWLNEDQYPA